jgi:DNA-binding transcriptional ArsR family regulator
VPGEPDTCDLLCLDLPKAERVREGLPSADYLEDLALQAGESVCVCDLAWIVGRDERLVSHHLRVLKAAGLARSGRDGKMVIYELSERGRALVAAVSSQVLAP